MEDKKVQKIERSLQGVNAGVREVIQRFDDYLKSQSFATLTTAIVGGGVDNAPTSQITTISCSELKGDIPKDSYFIISYPDGTHPKSILNKKADKVAGDTSIVIYDGSTPDDQTYYADFPYPVGSLLSAVNYAGNDTQFAAGNTTEIQYNTSGQLSGDSNLTFNDSTNTLHTLKISATEVASNISSGALYDGVTGHTQAASDDSTKVATTAFVQDAIAASGGGGGTPAGTNTQVQFNNAGAFGASASLHFNDTTDKLTTYALGCADATITNLIVSSGGYLNSGSDIKTDTEFLGNNIGTISDDAIYLTPFDFQSNSDAYAKPYIYIAGATAKSFSTSDYLTAGFVVPVGYEATHIEVKSSTSGGTTRTYSITQFDWDTSTYTPHGSYDVNTTEEIMNHAGTVATPLVGTAGRYWSVSFDPQYSSDLLLGAKITLART